MGDGTGTGIYVGWVDEWIPSRQRMTLTARFNEIDPELLGLLVGDNSLFPLDRPQPEPKRPEDERGPNTCYHGFHRPCEVCEPALLSTWISTLGGPR